MKNRILITITIILLGFSSCFGQLTNNLYFNQHDYEIAHYVGMKYNQIKEELGMPFFAAILDTVKMTRVHYYKANVNQDTIVFQIYYDKDLVCNAFSFMADNYKYKNEIVTMTKGYIVAGKWLVTPNRYLVTKIEHDDNTVILFYNTTIYPIILAKLNCIQKHLKKATVEYSNYDVEQAEIYIKELNQAILAAATIKNITQKELNSLSKIYKTYTDFISYNGVKISFLQQNSNVYFNFLPRDIEILKHKTLGEVDFSEIPNLIEF
jgi:hypothetical protein